MAARKSTQVKITAADVMSQIFADKSTKDDPSSLDELSMFLGASTQDILSALGDVPDEMLGEDRSGGFWVVGDYFDVADMLSHMGAVSTPQSVPEGVTVLGADDMATLIESITGVDSADEIPVGSSQTDDSTEEKTMDNATPTTDKGWTNDGGPTHFVEFDPTNLDALGHMILPEPEFIPEPPKGVSANAWELAHAAQTHSGRTYWAKFVKAQEEAYKAAEVAKEEKRAEMLAAFPLDPMTGKPISF